MKSIKNLISLGYLLMALLVIGIMYIWYKEWCDLEKLEVQNRHIDTFRQESHEIFVFLIELSLSGETVLEWEDADLEHYHPYEQAVFLSSHSYLQNPLSCLQGSSVRPDPPAPHRL